MPTQRLNIDIIAKDRTGKALKNVRGGFDKLKKSLFNVRTAIAGLGFGLLLRDLIKTGMEMEKLNLRFKFIFGSVNEGNKAFATLIDYASTVPFTLEQIAAGSGNLAVVSANAEELSENLKLVGNIAAVSGLEFQMAAEQLQRAFGAGAAAAEMFRDRGILAFMGFKSGVAVSIDETIKRFKEMFGEGGEFSKAALELAQTFEGTVSMLQDKIFKFKLAIIKGGLFPTLKSEFGKINELLDENAEKLDVIGQKIGAGMGVALTGLIRSTNELKVIMKVLVSLYTASFAVGAINNLIAFSNQMRKLARLTKTTAFFAMLSSKSFLTLVAKAGVAVAVYKSLDFALERMNDKIEEQALLNKVIIDDDKIKEAGIEKQKKKLKDFTDANKKLESVRTSLFTKEERAAYVRDKDLAILKELSALEGYTLENKAELIDRINVRYDEQAGLLDEVTDAAKKQKEIARELGMTFESSFEDAIIRGEQFRNVLQAIYKDILRIILRKTVTEKLGAFISTGVEGAIGGISNFFAPAQFGGSVTGGQPHIVGESGPELFVPSSSGNIVPNHQLGGGANIVQNINVTTGVQQTVRAEIIQLMPMLKKASVEAVLEERSRGGQMAQAMGAVTQNS